MSNLFVLISTPGCHVDVLIKDAVESVYFYQKEPVTVYSSERLIEEGLFSNLKDEIPVESYHFDDQSLSLSNEEQDALIVWDYRDDVINFMEALTVYLPQSDFELGSISTLVDCQRTQEHSVLRKWLEACIHFSDTVILGNRSDVSNSWLKEFEEHYQKKCFPCHFVLQKKDKLSNPALLFDLQARRMSLVFDELAEAVNHDWRSQVPDGAMIFDEGEDGEIGVDEDEDDDDEIEEDPYFVTHVNGKRQLYVPQITELFE